MRRLEIDQFKGWGPGLAKLAALEGVPELSFLGWLQDTDVRGLAASPYLKDLETLEIWLGSRHDLVVVKTLAALPGLKRLVLHQMYGGLQAGKQAQNLADRADALAEEANLQAGRALAVVHRPWECSFPLDGEIGHELYAGRLSCGELALCGFREGCAAVVLHRFSPEGDFQGYKEHCLPGARASCCERFRCRQFLTYLEKKFGFKLGPIRIKEFQAASGLSVSLYLARGFAWLAAPDDPPAPLGGSDREVCAFLHDWIKRGWFQIDIGDNDFMVDQSGKIFSWHTAPIPARLGGT